MPSEFVRRELIAVAVGLASLAACKDSTELALPDEALTIRSSEKVAKDVSSMRDELEALSGVLEFVESRDEKSFLRRMSPGGTLLGQVGEREDLFPVAGRHSLAIAAPNREDASEQLVFLDGEVIRSIGEEAGQIRNPVVAGDGSFAIYESNIESFRDLYRAECDTGAQRRLTEDGDGAFDPSLSPDSAHAVFVTTAAGQADLHIIATDGTSRHPLTETPTNETSPRWSPDGLSIAFSSDADGPERLFVMPAGGGAPKRLTANTASDEHEVDPLWSPKGDMLAFLQHNRAGQSELWVGSWPAGKAWRVSKDAGHAKFAEWSPDGRFLWYSEGLDQTDIWAARSDGSEWVRLTQGSSEAWLPRYRAGAAVE
tara:strand:+ start:58827 stop:59936 length:1110 start_codon:yes stop_codon:yes gene_type:complete